VFQNRMDGTLLRERSVFQSENEREFFKKDSKTDGQEGKKIRCKATI